MTGRAVLCLFLLNLDYCAGGAGVELAQIGLGVTFGVFAFVVIAFFVSLKVYLDSIKVKPRFQNNSNEILADEVNPNKLHNSSIRLRWTVPLTTTQHRIIKIRFFILVICNHKLAPKSPCMVMIPANPNGSGEHTHEGVLIGDKLSFKVKTVYTPKYMRCFTNEGYFSNTLHYNGVSHRAEVEDEHPNDNEKTRLV